MPAPKAHMTREEDHADDVTTAVFIIFLIVAFVSGLVFAFMTAHP